MTAWIAALIAAAALDLTSPGQVRVVRHGDERLAGISQVDVVVSTNGDVARCPVDRAQLQQSAVAVMGASRVKATVSEKASSWFYSVLVTTHSVAAGGTCASAVTAELVAQVEAMPEADRQAAPGTWGSLLVGPMSLVRETELITSPPVEHAARLQKLIGAQLAAIGARISLVNR